MLKNIPLYVLTVALLGVVAYLHSAPVAMSIIVLWGVQAAESVLTRKNRDADIVEIQAALAAAKSKLSSLEMHVVNVAERAKVILGENF